MKIPKTFATEKIVSVEGVRNHAMSGTPAPSLWEIDLESDFSPAIFRDGTTTNA